MDKRLKLLIVGLIILMAFVGVASAERVMEHWIQNPTDSNDYNYDLKYHNGGNPDCADIRCDGRLLKIENPAYLTTGTHTIPVDGIDVVITVHSAGNIDWSVSSGAISCVIVKGGNEANVYKYSPPVSSDTGLSTPINTNNNKPFGISHLDFCGYVAPEFPTLAVPVVMMIGIVGLVYIVRKREN